MVTRTLLALVLGLLTGTAPGQFWRQLKPATSPPGRFGHAMAFDPGRNRLVMFGGSSGSPRNDTWEWDGATWHEIKPTSAPPPRWNHAMAYDPVRRRILLFGGDGGTALFSDTWEWDGVNWAPLFWLTVYPTVVLGHSMSTDTKRQSIILYGGRDRSGYASADTWQWDGTAWKLLNPIARPAARWAHATAYDEDRGRMVLFGGRDATSATLGDTWEWDGSTWLLVSPAHRPDQRHDHVMAYEGRYQHVIVAAGLSTGKTCVWDGKDWKCVSKGGPDARTAATMAYDSSRREGLLFGGSRSGALGDTWVFVPGRVATFGASCGPRLDAATLVRIGAPLSLEVTTAATGVGGVVAFGASASQLGPFNLPLALDAFGLQGCWLLQSHDVLWPMAVANGRGQLSVGIPADQGLVGQHAYFQSYIVDLAANAAGVVTSNAADAEIGY